MSTLAPCRRGGCQLSCVMASKWTQSLGAISYPVSTHEAAFRAPSPPSSIQTTNTTAHPSSPMVDPHSKPNTTNPQSSARPQQARVPTCPTAHSSVGLRHPRAAHSSTMPLHSKLAALPACTGHACEGSKWPRETHLTARMRWRSKELKWEGQKWMDGQTHTVGIPRAHDAKPISTNTPTDANSSQSRRANSKLTATPPTSPLTPL